MAYGTPTNPVAGTVITVAYAAANILDPIRWLRLLTGNADPPGSSYVVVSTSTTGTSWQKVPADALAAGVALANLGYTPVNKLGDSMSGQLRIVRTQGADLNAFTNAPLAVQSPDAAVNPAETAGIGFHRPNSSGVYLYHAGSAAANILRLFTNAGADGTVWSALNQGAGSGLHADLLDGFHAGNGSGAIPVSNGSLNTNLNAALLGGFAAGNGSGAIPVSNGSLNTNLNADLLDNAHASSTPGASKIPIADGSGKLDAWITALTPGAYVPSGLVGLYRTAAAIAAGWTRETDLNGRIPVGAGTTFGATFTEANPYGSSWTITPSGTVAVVIASHAAVRRNANIAFGGGTDNVEDDHSHGITSATFTGSGASVWDSMALRAYVYAIKT